MRSPESRLGDVLARIAAKIIIAAAALFYLYGAAVHVMNMAGVNGFDWLRAPAKWQVLDVVYLVLDVTVVVGIVRGWWLGFAAFFVAALSQIVLYTAGRSWVLDVPAEFAPSPAQVAYLDGLVGFHIVSIVLVGLALILQRRAAK